MKKKPLIIIGIIVIVCIITVLAVILLGKGNDDANNNTPVDPPKEEITAVEFTVELIQYLEATDLKVEKKEKYEAYYAIKNSYDKEITNIEVRVVFVDENNNEIDSVNTNISSIKTGETIQEFYATTKDISNAKTIKIDTAQVAGTG